VVFHFGCLLFIETAPEDLCFSAGAGCIVSYVCFVDRGLSLLWLLHCKSIDFLCFPKRVG